MAPQGGFYEGPLAANCSFPGQAALKARREPGSSATAGASAALDPGSRAARSPGEHDNDRDMFKAEFQTFEERASAGKGVERLRALRAELARRGSTKFELT